MGEAMIGETAATPAGPDSPEAVAQEYHVNRRLAGDWAPRPDLERWASGHRKRFERELARLEDIGLGGAA